MAYKRLEIQIFVQFVNQKCVTLRMNIKDFII